MDEQFEYPLPVLSVDVDTLIIECKGDYEDHFTVKNVGGSVLSGKVLTHIRGLTFEPSEWEGNEARIVYRFSPNTDDGWKPGDVLNAGIVVQSNGGEKHIPIVIKLTKMAITTPDKVVIANLDDFFAYAGKNPIQARRLFAGSEFYMLLLAVGYEYMDAYELLLKDLNRERALDNFFILSGLKKKTAYTLPQRIVEFERKPDDLDMIYAHFLVQKTDGGYLEAPIIKQHNAPWLTLSAERLIASDFNEAHTAMVKFTLDPLRIKGRYAKETLVIGRSDALGGNPQNIDIVFKRLPPFAFKLSLEACAFEDQNTVVVNNNTGTELLLDIFCKDSYVRFAAKQYRVSGFCEIPFDIKLSPLAAAQLLFRKIPFFKTEIEIRTAYRDTVYRIKLPLTVGDW